MTLPTYLLTNTKNINLRYEDVIWIVEDFGLIYTEENW